MELPLRLRRSIAALLVAPALFAACTGGDDGSSAPRGSPTQAPPPITPTVAPASSTPVAPPTLPAEPPPTRGPATEDCVDGWVTPPEGSRRYERALDVIRRMTGVEGPLVVVDMRYFAGPESPPSDKGYLLVVQRWYVKLYAEEDPAFQGRFLAESRRFGRGVVAVAPYGTSGYASPDWIGFQYESADPEPDAYPGLPGTWSGTPYDFVEGGAGLEIQGLPEEVVGCLEGT